MKYLYELTLNNKESIMSKVMELCDRDICVNNEYKSSEIMQSTIQFVCNTILGFFRNQTWEHAKDALYSNCGSVIYNFHSEDLKPFLLSGIDIKLLITILKYFRSSMNNTIFQDLNDKGVFYKYIEMNNKCFDSLELSLYGYWEAVEKNEVLLKKVEQLKLQANESRELLNEIIEQDKIRTEFYSNLSHELRTPLNVILGTLQLVDMYSTKNTDSLMEKTRKYYKIMKQNCYRLLRLVNNLVDLNKLDAGYFYLNMENHDIVSIVSQIATSVSDYVENKGIRFLYCTKTDSKIIACDPDKIERILLNLLSNAIKFTDSGGKIIVEVWDADNKIYISVKDNGIGIPKEKQDMVFKRFVQIEKSLSRNHHGSGIGLSLAKSLVELHGGKINLISDSGLGCEFILELPIVQKTVMESPSKESQYSSNNKIEVINIEFSDIYS